MGEKFGCCEVMSWCKSISVIVINKKKVIMS